MNVTTFSISTNLGSATILDLPDECPHCHKNIRPYIINGYIRRDEEFLEALLVCPNRNCNNAFIGLYLNKNSVPLSESKKEFVFISTKNNSSLHQKVFSDNIINISPTFEKIYNEAFHAEQYKLLEICGGGYRKALEFLIKDYAISQRVDLRENIEKKMLMQCIDTYVTDTKVKSVAKRAVWLGNDETHYVRKWEGKNLEDLKKLIDLTLHWIEMEKLTESFEEDMPEGKK